MIDQTEITRKIAKLNDRLRTALKPGLVNVQIWAECREMVAVDILAAGSSWGRVVLTQGVLALGQSLLDDLLKSISEFDAFDEDNDPYREHDCAALKVAGKNFIWKIDYFDSDYEYRAEHPENDSPMTKRVLTIMTNFEY
jgi:Protein of unknown function (DUF3768)